jgi:alpha-glucuronidase
MYYNIRKYILFLFVFGMLSLVRAEQINDPLWLKYNEISNLDIKTSYRKSIKSIYIVNESPTIEKVKSELEHGLSGLLGVKIPTIATIENASVVVSKFETLDEHMKSLLTADLVNVKNGAYCIQSVILKGKRILVIAANDDLGLLYGSFHVLRIIQTNQPIGDLNIVEIPKTQIRILNHWDNLDRSSERGYAGLSIWDWHRLPDYLPARYTEYARLNASIGINGTVLTNVNSNALVLTPMYLEKVKALADLFRPYGIKVYLTARFSAPIEIGGLDTADPLDPKVQKWWDEKAREIYKIIPDFGGFLVKANSEGQPGPQNYGRGHADGANMMAKALAPFGGVVMWRAFVYSNDEPVDRAKQAYSEFVPLDGQFLPNVILQVKNGPIDFQPREPFHPMFGAMPKTPLMMEFQITQEYLGQATNLVFLAPMYEEVLKTDTRANGRSATISKVIDGSISNSALTGMAGVANVGDAANWTGHPIAQSNWYAFGRLAWNPEMESADIAQEWIKMTHGNDAEVVDVLQKMLLNSHETAVNYMTPLGLHHIMGTGHHYGPGPWVDNLGRADWNPVYYHQADSFGIGFDRTKSGSDAVSQYSLEIADKYNDLKSCPEKYLLWFHHVSWNYQMASGKSLWEELGYKYQEGVDSVRTMRKNWNLLQGKIDTECFDEVAMLLKTQEKEAMWWRDACLLYFQTFSKQALPQYVEKPKETLEYYQQLEFPYAPGN